MINVLITDDHPVVRRGINQILADDKRISLIDEAGNGRELIEKITRQKFDVILLDISLPDRSGLDMIAQIKKIQPAAAILMLSIHSEEIYAEKALRYGASGYLTKSSAPADLIRAIMRVSGGHRYISESMADILAENLITEEQKPLHHSLSPREMDVLVCFAQGKNVGEIASELSLSPKTISTYRVRILSKLKLKTTASIVHYALMEGITGLN
jgi:two-component system, NarL family, invasion response regulator UvrY